jgi:hypothetical protein
MVSKKEILVTIFWAIFLTLFAEREPRRPDIHDILPHHDSEEYLHEAEQDIRESKEIDFTIDDIVSFITQDKDNTLYQEPIYQVSYQNKYLFRSVMLSQGTLPINFYTTNLSNLGLIDEHAFQTTQYPYRVSLTKLFAGLGEFDKNHAHITFMKDEFLTVDNLSFRGDFKAKSTPYYFENFRMGSYFIDANYSMSDISFSTTFFSLDRDLRPGFYSLSDIGLYREKLNEKKSLAYFDISWRYLFLSYLTTDHKISAEHIYSSASFENNILALGTEFRYDRHGIKFATQYDHLQIDSSSFTDYNAYALYSYVSDDTCMSKYTINSDFFIFDDFSKINTFTRLSARTYRDFYLLSNVFYQDPIIFSIPFTYQNYITSSFYLGFAYQQNGNHLHNLSLCHLTHSHTTNKNNIYLDFLIGSRSLRQTHRFYNLSETFLSYTSEISTAVQVDNFVIGMQNKLRYDDFDSPFLLIPTYTNSTEISLTRLLPKNNKIALGTRIHFISKVFDEMNTTIPANHLIDAYFSIGITKLFDISFELNNITRRAYFGNEMLHDIHFTAFTTWYFIN